MIYSPYEWQGYNYTASREFVEEKGHFIKLIWQLLHVAQSVYYKWVSGKMSRRRSENEQPTKKIEQIHVENPDKDYHRINDGLRHNHSIASMERQ